MAHTRGRNPRLIAAAVVAGVAMLFMGWLVLVSGLGMPTWAVIALAAIWVVLVMVGVRYVRNGSYLVLAVPLVAFGVWLLAGWAGDLFLNWTA
jgi:hypothetical protein